MFGGVRSDADADRLAKKGGQRLRPVHLDVTGQGSIELAAALVGEAVGRDGLGGLVNNAGISLGGPVEYLSLDDWRLQLEVNVIGQVAVTKAFLPLLRAAGAGSSLSARWRAGWPVRSSLRTAHPSTRWRRSPSRCATSCDQQELGSY